MLVFPTVEPKIAIENRIPKELPKIPKLLPKAAPQSCFQSCAPKLFSKTIVPKLRFRKSVRQNGPPKPFCKGAPESCVPKSLPLLPKAVQSYYPKAAVFQFYTSKWLPKASPKVVCEIVPESCCSPKQLFSKLLRKNYSPKRFHP